MPAIGLVLFLSALDGTIVSTALPTISERLNLTPAEYSWVGSSYMIGMSVTTPFNGRLSDIVGRKPMLYSAIITFTIFSAICGASVNATMLIVARAFQGLGGGSLVALTLIVVSDIVPVHQRGYYQGAIGGAWGVASVAGPILGGVFTEKASWRWCFYVNLPFCVAALVILFYTLNLNPVKKTSLAVLYRTFDFLGLFLLIAGSILIIIGFSNAADHTFSQPSAYGTIIGGVIAMAGAIINFFYTERVPLCPPDLFRRRTPLLFLLSSFVQAIAFLPSSYLLPQLFQGVRGVSALGAGVDMVPFAVICSVSMMAAGLINSYFRIVRPVAWFGYALSALTFGLMYRFFTYPLDRGIQVGLLILAGIGTGVVIQVPMLILQAALPLKDMAAVTSAWTLTRSLGGSIGLTIFTAVLNTQLRAKFSRIQGYGTAFTVPRDTNGYARLHRLPDGPMKDQVLNAFASSLGLCWIIMAAMYALCLVGTLPTKSYSTSHKPAVHQNDVTESEDKKPGEIDGRNQAELTRLEDEKTDMPSRQIEKAVISEV
ncbi:hypothetical protein IAR55_001812 [Kwoniella newhampshirensis]|uniref:Major facilitator superfamily (MFS) profile domain-containing protein n=1 Tax=Kwoniella newhampshirensis TaxID=1651941 RepID=A0AAW0Z3D1_9TREE